MQSNLVSEISEAEISAYLNSYFSKLFNISKSVFVINHDIIHKIIIVQGVSRRRRKNVNTSIGQTYFYDSAKNEKDTAYFENPGVEPAFVYTV